MSEQETLEIIREAAAQHRRRLEDVIRRFGQEPIAVTLKSLDALWGDMNDLDIVIESTAERIGRRSRR